MADTPAHLLPSACFVCGGRPHQPSGHDYWSNSEAEAWFDRQPQPNYSPEAAYVAEHRPY